MYFLTLNYYYYQYVFNNLILIDLKVKILKYTNFYKK